MGMLEDDLTEGHKQANRAAAPTHYINVTSSNVGTKEADFFIAQGGLKEPWGKHWEPVTAPTLYAARNIGIKLRRQRFPDCHKTMGEDGEPPESYWPEGRGA